MSGSFQGERERLIPDVLQQLESRWGQTTVAIRHKWHKGTARLLGVNAVLGSLVSLSRTHGSARGHVQVGWGVWVDAGDVGIHSSVEHVDLCVRQKVSKVFLQHVGSAIIAASEAEK